METKDKRIKREIANSNERRRMQSINAGFQKLRRLLPVNDGEKLSKAAILQHASDFIQQIEREKTLLHDQNTLLRGTLLEAKGGTTALDTIDLDALPTIPITRHLAINITSNSNTNNCSNINNNSNQSSSTENSIDYCSSKEVSSNKNTKETNKNGNTEFKNNGNIDNNNYQERIAQQITSVAEIVSDRVMSPNGLVSTGVAKAAIALPLEVPYTSETAIRHHDLHPPPFKMSKVDPGSLDSQDITPKGQNLDTICKAIMEIEGDRVFTDENIKH